ncbi:MAG: DivIVA domain-containing protein [Actinomycetota bacterium]|jgi:cell division initiation protein|nr:DivIVA domain-containing protein [Actinomycetota bacterium]
MDFSADQVREAQFRDRVRGYNPEDVDSFLEQVARGIEEKDRRYDSLLEKLSQANDEVMRLKAALSEAMAANSGSESREVKVAPTQDANQELFEIFALAKQSADDLIARREVEARELLEKANFEAESLVGSARAEAQALRESELSALASQVSELEGRSAQLRSEIANLGEISVSSRERVRDVLRDALARVEESYSPIFSGEDFADEADEVEEAEDTY